jgi:hypothetical protein
MVQIMESWFLADVDALKALFGGGSSKATRRWKKFRRQMCLSA